jgi:hypothetical protein
MVVVEHVTLWKRRHTKAPVPSEAIEELENDALRRSGVLLIVRVSDWRSESGDRTDRRTRSIS